MQIEIERAAKYGLYGIVAFDKSGNEYVLNHNFKIDSTKMGDTLRKIREAKVINLNFWRKRQKGKW